MSAMRKRRGLVVTIFTFFLCVESTVNARPDFKKTRNPPSNLTVNLEDTSSERIVTAVRILTKPKVNRRGGPPSKQQKVAISPNQAIVFPDEDDTVVIVPPRRDERPSCAKWTTYCEKVEGYPEELIDRLLKVPSPLDDLFGVDDGPDEIANRLGDDTDISLCQSVDRIIFPKYGKTKSNKWKYIINQDGSEKFVQGIRVETCIRPGKPCSLLSNETLGYISFCKQKYITRRLISLSEEGQPTTDVFEVPSSCCCSYRKLPLEMLSFK